MDHEPSSLTKCNAFQPFLGPEIKVHRSSDVPECTEINKKATRDIASTSRLDPNHFKCILWTLSLLFWPNIVILAFRGLEMKVHRSSEVPRSNEIDRKPTRDLESTSQWGSKSFKIHIMDLELSILTNYIDFSHFWAWNEGLRVKWGTQMHWNQ